MEGVDVWGTAREFQTSKIKLQNQVLFTLTQLFYPSKANIIKFLTYGKIMTKLNKTS